MTRSLSRAQRGGPPSARPRLEVLEDRTVPSGLQGTPGFVTAGAFDPSTATWYLRSTNAAGAPDAGSFRYGAAGWTAVTGDWNGTGETGIGVFDPSTATWYLRNEAGAGAPDAGVFQFGGANWIPLVGDWTGTGKTGIGAFDPSTGTFYLRNSVGSGAPDAGVVRYGAAGWLPLVGDWNGTGQTGIGVFDPTTATFYLRNEANAGAPDAGQFAFGGSGWKPVAGDWTGTGQTGIGVFDPSTATFYLRNGTTAGLPDAGQFAFGGSNWQPVTGLFKGAATSFLPLNVTGTTLQNGQLVASGVVGDPTPFTLPLTLSAAQGSTTSTPILHLMLGPINLNLLGLQVTTSQICLNITAQSGPGNLLGNLLGSIANALNQPGATQASVLNGLSATDLATLENGVTSLLNGALGAVNAVPTPGSNPAATPTVTAPATNILHLSLGPVNLNLLGLVVNLDNCNNGPVTVDITAQPGPGNLLGNLLGGLTHLLDNNAPLGRVDALLRVIAHDLATLV